MCAVAAQKGTASEAPALSGEAKPSVPQLAYAEHEPADEDEEEEAGNDDCPVESD